MQNPLGVWQPFPFVGRWQVKRISPRRAPRGLSQRCFIVKQPSLLHAHRHDAHVAQINSVGGLDLGVAEFRVLIFGVAVYEQNLAGIQLGRGNQPFTEPFRSGSKAPSGRPTVLQFRP